MSDLQTYNMTTKNEPAGREAIVPYSKLQRLFSFKRSPGDWVTHKDDGGFGMVIAINAEEITVLWSVPPAHSMYRYNPLSYDEDIYIPVKKLAEKDFDMGQIHFK